MPLIEELKRRNVFRVAIAYAVVAWLVAQVAALGLESFAAPAWVIRSVLFLLVIGFPVALLLAWAFELTPEGLRRESSGDSGSSESGTSGRQLDRVIIVLLLLAVAWFSVDKFVLAPGEQDKSEAGVAEPDAAADGGSIASATPSIAVLPFVNMSDDPANEYFSEGLSEELLNLLARIPELQVAARTSSFSFKGKDTQVAQIGQELNVGHVLEGSVRKSGERVRITVQLIDAANGFHVFSQTYDRTLKDIFAVQDEIAAAVTEALRVSLLGDQPTADATDPEVYSLYLKGRYLNNLKGKENWENAALALNEALTIDPLYAPAWSELSTTYRYQVNNALLEIDEGINLAHTAAERALELDENLASAWVSLSNIRSMGEWDWSAAEEAMQRAFELEPRNVDVLNGMGMISNVLGRGDEAISAFEAAVDLDPLNQSALNSLGLAYIKSGRLDEAEAAFRQLLLLNPQYPWGHANLGTVMLVRGDAQQALQEIRRNPDNLVRDVMETLALMSLPDGDAADAAVADYLQKWGQSAPTWTAYVHAWGDNVDDAFASLELAYEQRRPSLIYILSSRFLTNLENDPRWDDLLERMGLLDAYVAMQEREGER
jgi:TolB-like protein/Flp pilus assembly protein TadD